MFGTNEKHSLLRAAFSRAGSFWAIYEDFREPILGLTVVKDGAMLDQRSNTFLLYPTFNGKALSYTYFADVSHVRIDTDKGSVELCMDGLDQLRVRGSGVGLRMVLRAEKPFGSAGGCRGLYPTPDSAWEADFGIYGKILYVSLSGAMHITDEWDWEKGEYNKVEIDFIPSSETGVFEAAVHEHNDYRARDAAYIPFDEIKADNLSEYNEFVDLNLKKPPKGWE